MSGLMELRERKAKSDSALLAVKTVHREAHGWMVLAAGGGVRYRGKLHPAPPNNVGNPYKPVNLAN
jgi:hypothetical protein